MNERKKAQLEHFLGEKRDLTIDYMDFITKIVDVDQVFTDEDIENAFKYIDHEDQGYIDREAFKRFLERKGADINEEFGKGDPFENLESLKTKKKIDIEESAPDNIKTLSSNNEGIFWISNKNL